MRYAHILVASHPTPMGGTIHVCQFCGPIKDEWCVAPIKKSISVDKAEGKDRTSFYLSDGATFMEEILKQNKESEKMWDEVSKVVERSKLAMDRLDIQMETIRVIDEKVRKLSGRIESSERSISNVGVNTFNKIEEIYERIEALEKNKPVSDPAITTFILPSAEEFFKQNGSETRRQFNSPGLEDFKVESRDGRFNVTFCVTDHYRPARVAFFVPSGKGYNWQYEILD